jgi:hypothetical protein
MKTADSTDDLKQRAAQTMRIIWGEHPFCHSERSRGISNSKQRNIRDVSVRAGLAYSLDMTKQLTDTRRQGRCSSVPAQGFFSSANS